MKTILILDDETAIRESIADYFEDILWRPIQAGSAEQALELLQQEQPDVSIVDIRLPGMDGNDFIRQASKLNSSIAFVICTGSPEYDIPQDIKSMARVSDILFQKPVHDLVELEKETLRLFESISHS